MFAALVLAALGVVAASAGSLLRGGKIARSWHRYELLTVDAA